MDSFHEILTVRPLLDWIKSYCQKQIRKKKCPRTPCTLLSFVRPFDISFTWLDAKIDALTQRSLFFARNFQHLHFYTSLFSTLHTLYSVNYDNLGCQVFQKQVQNQKDFWLESQHTRYLLEENHHTLCAELSKIGHHLRK